MQNSAPAPTPEPLEQPVAGIAPVAAAAESEAPGYTGVGMQTFDDGRIFRGEMLSGLPHGQGHMQFPDGSSYTGSFYYGRRQGAGEMHWPDGSYYNGEFINNKVSGRGE